MNMLSATANTLIRESGSVSSASEVTGLSRTYLSIDHNPVRTVRGSGERYGWGLRIIRNGKLGVAGEWGDIAPSALAERAIASCRYGPGAIFELPSCRPESFFPMEEELSALDHDGAMDYIKDIGLRLRRAVPGALLSVRMNWGNDEILLLNSRGLAASYSKTRAASVFSVSLPSHDGLLQSSCSVDTSGVLPKPDDVAETLALPLEGHGVPASSIVGRKNIVLAPQAFSVMLQAVRAGVSGELLAQGASPLASFKGKAILHPLLTIRDLPSLRSGAASAPFDSEGVPACDKTLFEAGVFTGFVHDLHSAALCGTESTGNSGRNLGEHSRPVCTNITVDPSPSASSDTLAETGSGVLVTSILSAGGGDAASGNYTFDCGRVFLFRRGEIYGVCDGCVLTGNVWETLSRVIALGGRQYRSGSNILPFVSLESVSVR